MDAHLLKFVSERCLLSVLKLREPETPGLVFLTGGGGAAFSNRKSPRPLCLACHHQLLPNHFHTDDQVPHVPLLLLTALQGVSLPKAWPNSDLVAQAAAREAGRCQGIGVRLAPWKLTKGTAALLTLQSSPCPAMP